MNDYDDSDDYSSVAFRARSNTWPLNRPDLATPNGVNIDETLPEIDLEEDDLFTTTDQLNPHTNYHWNNGLIEHDIMSWDPILNAQQHHNQSINNNHSNYHHHQHQHLHQQNQITSTNISNNITQVHHQQPHQHLNQLHHQNKNGGTHQSIQHNQQSHDPIVTGLDAPHVENHYQSNQLHQHQQNHIHDHHNQQQHQLIPDQQPHQPPQQQIHSLSSPHCVDPDDHIQQLHHLSLDGNHVISEQQHQHQHQPQTHYITAISSSPSSMCVYRPSNPLEIDYNISPNHPHHPHNLQQLSSARCDFDQHSEYDQHNPLLHHMTSSNQDPNSSSTHQLSSSLSTSGIGLSCDLDDLDYKVVDQTSILHNPSFEDQSIDPLQAQNQLNTDESPKPQANSASSSKSKLNAPRRNAWGNMSYADLITQAINSTNDKRLTLSEIYDWMVQHVPYFKDKGDSTSSAGWKNSVRHNLSLHSRFKRLQNEGTGKSSWWTINPEANVAKCARRRAASMEASKFEKKRGRAKKRAEAVRQGLVSYPSLSSSSLNGSASNLNQSQLELSNKESTTAIANKQNEPSIEIESGVSKLHRLLAPNSELYQIRGDRSSEQYAQGNVLNESIQNQHQNQRNCCQMCSS